MRRRGRRGEEHRQRHHDRELHELDVRHLDPEEEVNVDGEEGVDGEIEPDLRPWNVDVELQHKCVHLHEVDEDLGFVKQRSGNGQKRRRRRHQRGAGRRAHGDNAVAGLADGGDSLTVHNRAAYSGVSA